MHASRLSKKIAAAVAAGAIGAGGVAAAAYAQTRDDGARDGAHHVSGTPVATQSSSHPSKTSTPVGPDPNGPAGPGLCNAYEHVKVHGRALEHSVAFKNLATAAGGSDNIGAFCATIAHTGADDATNEPDDSGEPSEAPGKPSGPPPGHVKGRPSSVPSATR